MRHCAGLSLQPRSEILSCGSWCLSRDQAIRYDLRSSVCWRRIIALKHCDTVQDAGDKAKDIIDSGKDAVCGFLLKICCRVLCIILFHFASLSTSTCKS